MITYEMLLSADPAVWRSAGRTWRRVEAVVDRRASEIDAAGSELRRRWSGPASTAAGGAFDRLRDEVAASRPGFLEIEQVLADFASALAAAKASLLAAVSSAPHGVVVAPDGSVAALPPSASGAPAGDVPTRWAAAREVAAAIRAALELAAVADRYAAQRLAALAVDAGSGWVAVPPPFRPGPGTEPAAVRRWWDGLQPAHRRWLVRHEPRLAGRLDGVPAAARDQANRLLLDDERAALQARLAELRRRPRTPATFLAVARVERLLAGVDAIRERLEAEAGPRAYLLAVDTAGDGRAVLAVGDPDRADNVLTYVPGMTSDLPGIDGELDRTFAMATRCAELGPAERTSTVLWLDYDAPDFIHEAARAGPAHQAGPALHRFQEGLRATHEGPPAHQAVLGHSYGSLVVGATARDHGLSADTVVFVGSPGVGVDHADRLGLPPARVWSSTAYNDVIQYAALAPQAGLARLARAGLSPVTTLPLLVGLPATDLWFGRNPSDPDFGGQIFGSANRGHLGYWDAGNPALDGIARLALTGRVAIDGGWTAQ